MTQLRTNEYAVRFMDNFRLIRGCSGLSAEALATRSGTTRQSINNIEKCRFNLSLILYNCLRYAFLEDITNNPKESMMLKVILDVTVDNPEKYSDDVRENIIKFSSMIYPCIKREGRLFAVNGWISTLKATANIDILSISKNINPKCWLENNKKDKVLLIGC